MIWFPCHLSSFSVPSASFSGYSFPRYGRSWTSILSWGCWGTIHHVYIMQCLISDIAPVKSPKFSLISLRIESTFSKDSKKQFLYQRVNPDIDSLAATIMENLESGFPSVCSIHYWIDPPSLSALFWWIIENMSGVMLLRFLAWDPLIHTVLEISEQFMA